MSPSKSSETVPTRPWSAWPLRLALAALVAAVPLVFFGGSVTTLHAGLAIDGWWILEPGRGDWFLWAYPIEQWFRDVGTFVEHSHRLFGTLVGLLCIAAVVASFAVRAGRLSKDMALAALGGVIAQGVLGGLRVIDKSSDLAFVHGAVGQAVFALLGASALVHARPWSMALGQPTRQVHALRRTALWTTALVYVQIFLGAWLRHGQSQAALVAHLVFLMVALWGSMRLLRDLRRCAEESAIGALERRIFVRLRRALAIALVLQVLLGVLAFLTVYVIIGRHPSDVSQALFPTLHVLGGATLLLACVASVLWAQRLVQRVPQDELAHGGLPSRASLGAAR